MKRVLIVEDLPQVAEHLKGLLGREKEVQVTGVMDQADAAVKQASTEKPDVVMIDYFLGKKETIGVDVAKRIRAASPGTRIIVVTIPQKPVPPRPDEGIDAVFVLPGGANELAQALWEGPAGVHYLLAPPRPEQADLVSVSDLPNALGLLAQAHDHVIVDVPPRLGDDALGILDASSTILLVVTYAPPAIATARAAIETFQMLGYAKQKPILAVLNRSDESGDMSRGALEHALGVPIAAEIPTDRKRVEGSLAKQEPLVVTDPTSPVGQAFVQLAAALVAQKRK
ncbi:MAG: response regulator [Chloroflexi bacterium]|nr:response regulator [Chloroflexota bacterium]